jgi:glycosyltransferase involved in cell wall biosynthesis
MGNNPDKRRKACHVYFQFYNSLLYRESRALKDRGFDVDIICLRSSKGEKRIEIIEGIKIYRIQSRSYGEKSKYGYFFSLILFIIKSFVLLSCLGLKNRYRIIHITSPPDLIVFTAILPKILGGKIILDIHDINPELFMRKLNRGENSTIIKALKVIEKCSVCFSDHVITVTDLWKDKLNERSMGKKKCTVLLNVPDDHLFKPIKEKNKNDTFNLYYHGTLEDHFGVETLLLAMVRLHKEIPRIRLNIYGKGRMEDELKSMAERNGIKDCVFFKGVVPFHELPFVLSNADLGVVPTKKSVFSNEALSMKSLEYIALGIPIVISKTAAHDLYFHPSMVEFFEPENSDDLARSVLRLFKDEQKRASLVNHAFEFMNKHGWPQAKKIYCDIIDSLISNPSK